MPPLEPLTVPIFEVWEADGIRQYGSVIGHTSIVEWRAKALALDRPGLHHEVAEDERGRVYLVHIRDAIVEGD